MQEKQELISLGMDVAVVLFAKLSADGVTMTPAAWKVLGEHAAQSIEAATGVPGEDMALTLQPIVDGMLEKIK
jgi:hypothetical protein